MHILSILLFMTGDEFYDQFMVIGALVLGVCIIVAVIVVAVCYCFCCKNGKVLLHIYCNYITYWSYYFIMNSFFLNKETCSIVGNRVAQTYVVVVYLAKIKCLSKISHPKSNFYSENMDRTNTLYSTKLELKFTKLQYIRTLYLCCKTLGLTALLEYLIALSEC